MSMSLYAIIRLCEDDTISHVSFLKPPVYANYTLTSDVLDLCLLADIHIAVAILRSPNRLVLRKCA